MKAIMYAAGRAMRLGPAYAEQPKVLIEFDGETLLARHCRRLAAAGVTELVVVTGHRRELLAEALCRHAPAHGLLPVELFNADFAEGSVLSMAVSLPVLEAERAPFFVMDADVLYGPALLPRLRASAHRSALLVDRNFSVADDDPVLVPLRGGRPFDFVKKWRGECDALGESVGFFKLDPAEVPLLAAETRARLAGARRRESLDDVLRVLVQRGRLGAEDITGEPWTEIDFPEDVAFANAEVLPRVRAQDGR
jgi:choline kinase